MTPLKVLHVLGATDRGGIETWLVRLLPKLDRSRLQIDIAVHSPTAGAYDQTLSNLGVGIHRCTEPHKPWRYVPRLRAILNEHGPYQVLHGQQYLFNGALLRWARQAGVPVRIAHQHPLADIGGVSPLRWAYRRMMTALINRNATCLMYPSVASRIAFEALGGDPRLPSRIAPNCVELERFTRTIDRNEIRRSLGLPTDRPLVVYVARFVPHKRHALVFPVADRLQAKGQAVHFALAGSHGECHDQLAEQARGRSDVTLHTGLADVTSLLLAADAFFFPSIEEGFGVVAVEAQAAGLPVVATDLPSLREALCPGMHPLLFPADDAVKAADLLAPLLMDAERRLQLGNEGRAWAQQFSVDAAAQALQTCYDDLCAGLPQARG